MACTFYTSPTLQSFRELFMPSIIMNQMLGLLLGKMVHAGASRFLLGRIHLEFFNLPLVRELQIVALSGFGASDVYL